MPHTTQPGTLVALNYESYPTAPSTSDIFADLSRMWAATHPAGVARPPEPLPLPPPIFPVPGPAPTPSGPSALDQCKAACRQRFTSCIFESGPLVCSCFIGCAQSGGEIGPKKDILEQIGPIIAIVIGIVLVLIAVALIVR